SLGPHPSAPASMFLWLRIFSLGKKLFLNRIHLSDLKIMFYLCFEFLESLFPKCHRSTSVDTGPKGKENLESPKGTNRFQGPTSDPRAWGNLKKFELKSDVFIRV